jgi:hypothetical protein
VVPSKYRHSKYLGRSAGIKPVSFLPRFMLGTEIPGTTRRNFLPVYTWFFNSEEFPGKSRHIKHLGRSAGFKPVSFWTRFVLGTYPTAGHSEPGAIVSSL